MKNASTFLYSGSITTNANGSSPWFAVAHGGSGRLEVAWTGLNAFDGVVYLHCSSGAAPGNAGLLPSSLIALDSAADSQLYEILYQSYDFLRVVYEHGSVTAGTLTWSYKGV